MRAASLVFASALLVHYASGMDLYVSTTGSDSVSRAANTLAAPWRTIQRAASLAQAGDVVYVRGGTYAEFITMGVSGTAVAPILFRNYPEEEVIVDPVDAQFSSARENILFIQNRSHLIVQGMTFQGLSYTGDTLTPSGIQIGTRGSGSCVGVQIRNCIVRRIYNNSTELRNSGVNAHGIKVFGRTATPLSGLIIDGCEVTDLRLGASEALVVNGNVTDFRITRNRVHHCNNIGIDAIGYENVGPSGQDRARNGILSDNLVYEIDSSFNPAYGGSLTTGGGSRSAAGIYLDGATACTVERNQVHHCNFGIEVATESQDTGATTDQNIIRNNLLRHNHSAGIIMGGFDAQRGAASNNRILNNTIYDSGEALYLQFYLTSNEFRNNIIVSSRSSARVIYQPGGAALGNTNVFSHNLYFPLNGAANPSFRLSTGNVNGLAAWQARPESGGDIGASVGNPQFTEPVPTQGSSSAAYKLRASSPAINTGQPTFTPGVNEEDFYHGSRLKDGTIDRGADER